MPERRRFEFATAAAAAVLIVLLALLAPMALAEELAPDALINPSEKHRSPTRNTPQPRAFRGTGAKEFPILCSSARISGKTTSCDSRTAIAGAKQAL